VVHVLGNHISNVTGVTGSTSGVRGAKNSVQDSGVTGVTGFRTVPPGRKTVGGCFRTGNTGNTGNMGSAKSTGTPPLVKGEDGATPLATVLTRDP